MQNLEIISLNIWQIVISLLNLLILFLLIKYFLYKPVRKALKKREESVEKVYSDAEAAKNAAENDKAEWERILENANAEADGIIKDAVSKATGRKESIVSEARTQADEILRQAKNDAELEKKKAKADIKREIVDVSSRLTEKMLSREINEQDHKQLIDSFIDDMGESK